MIIAEHSDVGGWHRVSDTISQEVIDEVVKRLVEGLDPERIILFGSYAYGQPDAGSDLDLVIVVDESRESPHRRDQAAYRCLRGIPVAKDLLVMTRAELERESSVATSFARVVVDRGKVLYERG